MNAGLLLTKFSLHPDHDSFSSPDNKHYLARLRGCRPSPDYGRAYRRWEAQLQALPGTVIAARFAVAGRMIVGIGAASVLESSVTMNRPWGMPLIPGAALKGLARHYTDAMIAAGHVTAAQGEALFGTTGAAAYLTWLDAWYVPPEDAQASPFALDVVTGHHRSYYRDPAHNPPWDFEDPSPSYFISVSGEFLLAIQAPDQDWAFAAMQLLRRGLDEWGIGAKTNAGYGRLTLAAYEQEWVRDRQDEAAKQVEAELAAAEAAEAEEQQARADEQAALQCAAELATLLAEVADPKVDANLRANHWATVWGQLTDDAKTDAGTKILRRLQHRKAVYHRITGRVLPDYNNVPGAPKAYIRDLLAWIDTHAPGVAG